MFKFWIAVSRRVSSKCSPIEPKWWWYDVWKTPSSPSTRCLLPSFRCRTHLTNWVNILLFCPQSFILYFLFHSFYLFINSIMYVWELNISFLPTSHIYVQYSCFFYFVFLLLCVSSTLCFFYFVFLLLCVSSTLCFFYFVFLLLCVSSTSCFFYFVFHNSKLKLMYSIFQFLN